jgi:secreted trypsin-like serine protease
MTKQTLISNRQYPRFVVVTFLLCISLIVRQQRTNNKNSNTYIFVEGVGKIVGGTTVTNVTRYPYYARPASRYLCGASLIWGNVLVTAAHCGSLVWSSGVWLGGIKRPFDSNSKFYNVSKIIIHPQYNGVNNYNDIALLFLDKFVPNTTTTYATLNYNSTIPAVASTMTAIGYGRLSEGGSTSSTLQQVDLQVESYKVCSATYYSILDRIMICNRGLPYGGKDTCNGDSGGPLLIKNTNTIVALVSYGYGCARRNTPAVNTRISPYQSWIQVTICAQKLLPLPSYCTKKKKGTRKKFIV